jgi:hypothetical protein
VVTSKLIRPKRRFIGAGMVFPEHEKAGNMEAPAAAAAERRMNSRLDSFNLVLTEAISAHVNE